MELRRLTNRPPKRKANSEICEIPTKRRRLFSDDLAVERLKDSSHSNMEVYYFASMYRSPAGSLHSICLSHPDGNTAVASCTSSSALKAGSHKILARSRSRMLVAKSSRIAQLEGLFKELERLRIEDHGSVYPAIGNLHNLPIGNGPPTDGTSSSVRGRSDERFDYNSTTVSCLKKLSKAECDALYEKLDHLGKGGFGSVWAGNRKQDNQPVAMKHIRMIDIVMEEGNDPRTVLPLEISLMLKVQGERGSASQGAAVLLLDWFILDKELILVQERPVPSTDLLRYMKTKGGFLEEQEAKLILQQLIKAILHIHSRGVLHRDIKPENILIETGSDMPGVRIIDFGCGCFLHNGMYQQFSGTHHYIPPEWYLHGSYRAEPMTVWQVGVLAYRMLVGKHPFSTKKDITSKEPCFGSGLLPDCQEFVRSCLAKQPQERPPLDCLLDHPWLQKSRLMNLGISLCTELNVALPVPRGVKGYCAGILCV